MYMYVCNYGQYSCTYFSCRNVVVVICIILVIGGLAVYFGYVKRHQNVQSGPLDNGAIHENGDVLAGLSPRTPEVETNPPDSESGRVMRRQRRTDVARGNEVFPPETDGGLPDVPALDTVAYGRYTVHTCNCLHLCVN